MYICYNIMNLEIYYNYFLQQKFLFIMINIIIGI